MTEGFALDLVGFADVTCHGALKTGHVTVTPEPATLCLLALGGLLAVKPRLGRITG